MTCPRTAYSGRTITFATMHGKELLAQDTFQNTLGANVTAAAGLDTDQFGTFAGDIPRPLSPRDSARAKARLGMHLAGTTLGLASEGTFTSGFGLLVENTEILIFIDNTLGLEIVEGSVTTSPVAGGRRITNAREALTFASAIGFPDQGVILQSAQNDRTYAHKNITQLEVLGDTTEALLKQHHSVVILPDYRAHKAPSRAAAIRALCEKMAQRLATECPRCRAPGFGHTNVEHGLPCSSCGSATQVIAADIHGCGRCTHQTRTPRRHAHADPEWCDHCNP
ncbi:hypothetical protein E3T28_00360 [Cryobacterium sinapicolor]|uniref:DUF6671 domain-containing protein n=1 Tax=Cryobacterium sinapicolor TaxID=1259236 RepID=A0ABY2JKC4_9MICO|nr:MULTISPECIES: DUF6671 family protein [Cryobacterium]TFC89598.1 hypothetical protein E3O67_06740 [Cryobacterium sp. TMT3-29-2]TFD05836.1 hypothetical protein E3T28_00360 [Cryobacterium sinapicolor]